MNKNEYFISLPLRQEGKAHNTFILPWLRIDTGGLGMIRGTYILMFILKVRQNRSLADLVFVGLLSK